MAFLSNPPVPYIGSVRGVSPGLLISVSGQPTSQAKWFAINLQCGPSMNPRDDIALHISPRFEGPVSKVIRNSLQGGQWGIEENFGHFPFAPDAPFEILVMVEADLFKIAINGQHFTEFRHRMPLGRINTLAIDGDLHLHVVRYEGGDAGIPPESAYQQPHLTSSGSYSMPIPTSGPSYGGGSGSNLQAQPYGAPHNTSGYQTAPGAGYGSGGQGYQSAPGPGYGSGGQGYQSAPGAPYSSPGFTHSGSGQNFSSPGYT
uniref:Galectin n=1 Tax=Plectus sambesii TaxID=2011161 RepID=A0A914UNN8_9BILA